MTVVVPTEDTPTSPDPVVTAATPLLTGLATVLENPKNPPLNQRTLDVLSVGVFVAVALITLLAVWEAYERGHAEAATLAALGFGALLSGLPWGAPRSGRV